jgi:TPR repeat protein
LKQQKCISFSSCFCPILQPQYLRLFLHARRLGGSGHWELAYRGYTAAAALQHGPSLAALSVLHARGWAGLKQDVDAAFVHARAGCDLQCADSMGALALCCMLQQEPLNDAMMDKAAAMAMESAAAGSATGNTVLGCMLAKGWHTVGMDAAAAAAAFLCAASSPHPCADAMYRYSVCCTLGLGIPVNIRIAVEYLRASAELGHPDGLYDMAALHMKGTAGVLKDQGVAVSMLSLAADQQHIAACVALAGVISKGHMFDSYNDRASELIVRAATAGNAFAQTVVGRLHETGHSLFSFLEAQPARERRAVVWYTRASDQGHVEAQAMLGGLLIAADWSCKEEREEGQRLLAAAASKGHTTSIAILSAMGTSTLSSRSKVGV